ncbi:Uncharacterised protein [Chlamydia trachomatis]|nr:Uncharacterised protein [Chlamydia trachomatis]CRH89505.1 Uncharacterised protein [Chlamydia trachomatis]
MLVDDLRSRQGVGVEEVGALVGFVVTLNIPITQRQLEGGLVGSLAPKLANASLDRRIHSLLNSRNRGGVGLGDNEGDGVLGLAALDRVRLPHMRIAEADFAGDNTGRILSSHNLILLSVRYLFV